MSDLTAPRAVLFDWDNTLVDSWQVIHEALHETFVAFDRKPWTIDQTKSWVRHSMREAFPRLFGDRAEAASERFYEAYRRIHLARVQPLANAKDVLDDLVAQGLYLAVLSSKNGDLLRAEAKHLGLADYFARLVGATDTPSDKPSPVAFNHALEPSGVPAGAAVWYVGDTGLDVICARRANCVAVLVGPSPALDGDEPQEPDLNFSSLAEMRGFLTRFRRTI
ncbi:MAG: HAD family hydrolase [Alphaproteobacteria bacterium]|nr:HAD family hydrolase [Alphaproteobacteria bacterium]